MIKKIILEFNEVDLSSQEMCKRESYKESGLYLVNDGIARFLAMVPEEVGSFVSTITVPIKELEKYGLHKQVSFNEEPIQSISGTIEPKGEWVSAETLLKVITQLTKV